MEIGLCSICFHESPLVEVLDLAKKTGFDGVEIWGEEPHTLYPFDKKKIENISQMVKERGLSISMFGSYISPSMKNFKEKAKESLKITHTLGAPLMRVWAGNKGSKEADKENWKVCIEGFKWLSQEAKKYNITLAIEMHEGTLADLGKSALNLIEKVGEDNLKANFQVNFTLQKDDPMERLKLVSPYIVNCHLQNFKNFQKDKNSFTERSLLKEGIVNYKEIISFLKGKDFKGYLEVEFEKDPKEENLKKDYEFLKELLSG